MSADIDITLSWESPLPVDDLPTVQAYVLLKSLGISNDSIMRKLGYDPDEELAKSIAEDAKAMANNPLMQQQPLPPPVPGVAPLPGQQPTSLHGGNQQQSGG